MKNVFNRSVNLKKYLRRHYLGFVVVASVGMISGLQAEDSQVSPPIHRTGALPLTEKHIEHIKANWPRVRGVRPNKYGAARIQAYMADKGFALMGLEAVSEDEEEFITDKNSDSDSFASHEQRMMQLALPSKVDNSKLACFPPIGNQKSLGSCVGWASTYYHATHEYGLLNGINNKTSSQGIRSPKWTYNMINWGNDGGSYPTDAYELLQSNGAVAYSAFPYDTNYRQWDLKTEDWISALSYRMNPVVYFTIDDSSDIETLKQILNNGHLVTFTTFANSWQYSKVSADPSQGSNPYVGQRAISWMNGTSGGHHTTIVGYDDDVWIDVNGNGKVDQGEKGAFLVANSWGTGWANAGFIWVAYDALYKTSQVANGPSANRRQIASMLFSVTPKQANYKPKAIAKFSLSLASRKELKMGLGVSAADANAPAKKFVSGGLTADGGAYAFDGQAPTLQTATFALDATDLLPATNASQKYYLITQDTASGNPVKLNSYAIADLVNNREVSYQGTLPITVDQSTAQPFIVYQQGPGADTTPPTVAITYPTNQATISGSVFATVNVSDNVKVARVDFHVDSELVSTDLTAPFVLALDTTKLSNGQHIITAIAYDEAGNHADHAVTVKVQNQVSPDFPSYLTFQQRKVGGWGSGAQYDCTLKNQGTKPVSNVKIKFAVPPASIYLWNVDIVASDSQSVTVGLPSWQPTLAPGEVLSFGFVIQPETEPRVTFVSAKQE